MASLCQSSKSEYFIYAYVVVFCKNKVFSMDSKKISLKITK